YTTLFRSPMVNVAAVAGSGAERRSVAFAASTYSAYARPAANASRTPPTNRAEGSSGPDGDATSSAVPSTPSTSATRTRGAGRAPNSHGASAAMTSGAEQTATSATTAMPATVTAAKNAAWKAA